MNMKSWMRGLSALVLVATAGTLLACSDLLGTDAKLAEEDVLAQLDPGIHPVLVVAQQQGEEATVELHLKRVEVASKVASFQGELTYDAQTLTLTGAKVPQGITGAWNEVEKGKVRFAGVSMEGIETGAVLSLSFQAKKPVRANAFRLKMEEVVASEGFESLTSKIQVKDVPLLSRSPIQ